MSPWFRRRPPEAAAEAEREPVPEPRPAEVGLIAEAEPTTGPEAKDDGEISPTRLDAALQRLRDETPAREEGQQP